VSLILFPITLTYYVSFTDLNQSSEMIIFESLLTTFEASFIFEAAGAVAKIGSRLKSKPKQI
jgi:hypothetical protein